MIATAGRDRPLLAGRHVDSPDLGAILVGHHVRGLADIGDFPAVGADLGVARGAEVEQVASGKERVWSLGRNGARRDTEHGCGEQ